MSNMSAHVHHSAVHSSPWTLRGFLLRQDQRETPLEKTDSEVNCSKRRSDCAVKIFTTKGDSHRRTGMVDGREVVFELRESVVQKPKTSRKERTTQSSLGSLNATQSPWDDRVRFWLLQYRVGTLTLLYVGAFVALNFIFAGLWTIQSGKCCDDPTLKFTEVFDFAIQTSTTIGYGGYVPIDRFSNFLVFALSVLTLILNTVYGGLLFQKFVSPSAKLEFSEVMTLSNVNGLPCMEFRVGNADGALNPLTNVSVTLKFLYQIPFTDETGEERNFTQTEELKLLYNKCTILAELIWTLRHIVDEHSPLYGLDLLGNAGKRIVVFEVSLNATQELSGNSLLGRTCYMVEDIMIGHRFQEETVWNPETKVCVSDFGKMHEIVPFPVWHPVKRSNK